MTIEPPRADLEEILSRAESSLRSLDGKSLLLIGAGGFLGGYLAHALANANDRLLRRGCRLQLVDTFVTGTPRRLQALLGRPDCTLVNASVTAIDRIDAQFVVHAASIASPPVYRRLPLETVEVNALGTWHVLRLAATEMTESVLYLSTSEVYGDPEASAVPTAEEYVGRVSFTGPRACYDESKRLAETLCRLYYEQHRVRVKVARPFNVYGPTLGLDDGRIVPDLMRQGLAGGPLVLYSDGSATRSFCYITDAIVGFLDLLAFGKDGEAYNIGMPEEVSIRRLAEMTAERFGGIAIRHQTSTDPRYLTDNPQRRCPDISKATAALPWRPIVGLEEGLQRTVDYYRHAAA